MQTEHRPLCVYRKGNSVCISFWYQLPLFMKRYPADCMQKASSRAEQAEPTDAISLTVGSEAPDLCSELYACYKKTPHMLLRCAALFILGLLLVSLARWDFTEEISRHFRVLVIARYSPLVDRKDCIHIPKWTWECITQAARCPSIPFFKSLFVLISTTQLARPWDVIWQTSLSAAGGKWLLQSNSTLGHQRSTTLVVEV